MYKNVQSLQQSPIWALQRTVIYIMVHIIITIERMLHDCVQNRIHIGTGFVSPSSLYLQSMAMVKGK